MATPIADPEPATTQSSKNSNRKWAVAANSTRVVADRIIFVRSNQVHAIGGHPHRTQDVERERWYHFLVQVLPAFLIAGFGMTCAGIVLDLVQSWRFFVDVPEIFILIPPLLGLKGNVEMTLASRLSTQTQSVVVTFVATVAATAVACATRGSEALGHFPLLCASSLTTSSISTLAIGLLLIVVTLTATRFKINPDNIGTPIASALGDLSNIVVLAHFGTWYYDFHLSYFWINVVICVAILAVVPLFAYAAYRDDATRPVLKSGWVPILMSMFISGGGGYILENAIRIFPQIALFQPVINGVGGNLVAVHASRLSTFFHKASPSPGVLPEKWRLMRLASPVRAFASRSWDSSSARILLLLVVPGHLLFSLFGRLLNTGEPAPSSVLFTICYLVAASTQVILLLFVCQFLVALLWRVKLDPDNAAIPYMTALGDLLGTGFLYIAFLLARSMNAV